MEKPNQQDVPVLRPNLMNLFEQANVVSKKKNTKQLQLFSALQWRQKYQNKEYYEYLFEHSYIPLRLIQILNGEMKGLGTGTFVWPAAHVFAKYMEINCSEAFQGKHICDLGSGTGLTGFVAAKLGADVILTDQACILNIMDENNRLFQEWITMNSSTLSSNIGSITIQEYDWNELKPLSNRPFDYILVSDCVLPKLYPIELLVNACIALMTPYKTKAIFSYEHRIYPYYDPRQVSFLIPNIVY
jgi:2-polyprenyl-3-methyl-5-hydroxy-6-metoxy-1,4-benzoquinol methylase